MARKMRRHASASFFLCLVAASSFASVPAFARDADDVLLPMAIITPVSMTMALVRPVPKPMLVPVAFPVTRARARAAVPISAPETVDRSRIRATWSIGVFR